MSYFKRKFLINIQQNKIITNKYISKFAGKKKTKRESANLERDTEREYSSTRKEKKKIDTERERVTESRCFKVAAVYAT
jgi:hypothetical protein